MINIGETIKKLRIKNKLTQQQLADKLFVSDKTISSWESSRTEPDFNMLSDICKALNTSFFTLIGSENPNNLEIEIKIIASKKEQDRILDLIKNDSKFIIEEDQNAIYYKLPHRKMNNEWLRVRKENNRYILNYKKKPNNEVIEEYEVSIDSIDNLRTIFDSLDFKELLRVNKHRTTYLYKDKYEFSFDNVELLGTYVEIELKKQDYDNEKEIERLLNLLKELSININNIETRRYPELIERLNKTNR